MHLSERYAEGEISIDEALQTVNSYHGLTKHCNGYNFRRWIEENIVFSHQSSPEGKSSMSRLKANKPRDHPGKARKFYDIVPRDDGLVDVYLAPDVQTHDTNLGIREYDISVRAVLGVVPWPELEADIRLRYDDWCASAAVIDL